MNREQKAVVIEEVATQIQESGAVFAVDYRGISVPQAADLRSKLDDAGARFRVVKNTLTDLAADKAGAESLKEVLEGPTAFTFVRPDGDVALAAKALAQFKREHDVLGFKGGVMNGEPLTVEQLMSLSRLPARDVLHAQLVGVVASPITGLVRGLNALIAGLAIQLGQIVEQGLLPGGDAPAEAAAEEPAAEEPAAEEPAAEAAPDETAAEAEPADEAADEAPAEEQAEETDLPSEGEDEKEG
jgi:large subunit ribosomal protein L10